MLNQASEELVRSNVLLLCNMPEHGADANTILDHIVAFKKFSKHHVFLYSNIGDISLSLDIERFDVIIIHYSICLLGNYYLSQKSKKRIREFKGLKLAFLQDEYRQINNMLFQLQYLKIDVLYTCFPKSEMNKIYTPDKLPYLNKYNTLTGYVPDKLIKFNYQKPMTQRHTHVGYRARKLPFWYGELSYEKWDIVNQWKKNVHEPDIYEDISFHEKDRIYGDKWIEFLNSCKTTLGVESGASVMDFTGDLEKQIDLHQALYPKDSFYEVQRRYLQEHEGRYKLNQISPRCFEAIALKTVLVLYEGDYSNILIPNRHHIVLKKDFSNISDVLSKIRDDEFLQNMADIAYNEIAQNAKYHYQTFVKNLDKIIHLEFEMRNKKSACKKYNIDEFQEAIKARNTLLNIKKQLMRTFKRLPPNMQGMIRICRKPNVFFKYLTLRIAGYLPNSLKKKLFQL